MSRYKNENTRLVTRGNPGETEKGQRLVAKVNPVAGKLAIQKSPVKPGGEGPETLEEESNKFLSTLVVPNDVNFRKTGPPGYARNMPGFRTFVVSTIRRLMSEEKSADKETKERKMDVRQPVRQLPDSGFAKNEKESNRITTASTEGFGMLSLSKSRKALTARKKLLSGKPVITMRNRLSQFIGKEGTAGKRGIFLPVAADRNDIKNQSEPSERQPFTRTRRPETPLTVEESHPKRENYDLEEALKNASVISSTHWLNEEESVGETVSTGFNANLPINAEEENNVKDLEEEVNTPLLDFEIQIPDITVQSSDLPEIVEEENSPDNEQPLDSDDTTAGVKNQE